MCLLRVADASAVRGSGPQLLHEGDVAAHRLALRQAAQLQPGRVLGRAHEIEKAGLFALRVALRTLLVERVELEQGVVVGTVIQPFHVLGGLIECMAEIVHGVAMGRVARNFAMVRAAADVGAIPCGPPACPGSVMSRTAAAPVLTIDGPSGSGKGTISRRVA